MNVNLWECTHLGADRFAAIAIAFPHGYMYGRMRSENVSELMSYLEKGYPYPPCYRGQLGLDSIEQIVQAFGHSFWFDHNIESAKVTIDSVLRISSDEAKASVTVSDKFSPLIHARFALRLSKQSFVTYMDCDGVDANQLKRVSRWVISESRRNDGSTD